jgi:CBS domain-containing protein
MCNIPGEAGVNAISPTAAPRCRLGRQNAMRAQDIMTANVVTITPDTAVRDVAKLMIDRRISGMPVVNSGGHLVGIVTDGDLYHRSELGTDRRRKSWLEIFGFDTRQARDFVEGHAATAGDVMTKRVFAVTPQTLVVQIAHLFERQRIRRVPVVANGGKRTVRERRKNKAGRQTQTSQTVLISTRFYPARSVSL